MDVLRRANTRLNTDARLQRSLQLAACVLCMAVGGSTYNFSTYGTSLAAAAGFSHATLSLVASTGLAVQYVSAAAVGAAVDRGGPRLVILAASVLFACGYAGLAAVADRIVHSSALAVLFYSAVGLACSCCYNAALATSLRCFPPAEHSLVVGFLVACFALSATFFSLMSRLFVTDAGRFLLVDYLHFAATFSAIVVAVCGLAMRTILPDTRYSKVIPANIFPDDHSLHDLPSSSIGVIPMVSIPIAGGRRRSLSSTHPVSIKSAVIDRDVNTAGVAGSSSIGIGATNHSAHPDLTLQCNNGSSIIFERRKSVGSTEAFGASTRVSGVSASNNSVDIHLNHICTSSFESIDEKPYDGPRRDAQQIQTTANVTTTTTTANNTTIATNSTMRNQMGNTPLNSLSSRQSTQTPLTVAVTVPSIEHSLSTADQSGNSALGITPPTAVSLRRRDSDVGFASGGDDDHGTVKDRPLYATREGILMFALFGIVSGTSMMMINNIGTVAHSTLLQMATPNAVLREQTLLVTVFSVATALSRVGSGALQRMLAVDHMVLISHACAMVAMGQIFAALSSTLGQLRLATAVTAAGAGTVYALMPVAVSSLCGVERFGRTWGLFQIPAAVTGELLNMAMGAALDAVGHPAYRVFAVTTVLAATCAGAAFLASSARGALV